MFNNAAAVERHPVRMKSIARSLLKSVGRAAMPGASPPRPACSVQSVKVPLPLLRHKRFEAAVCPKGKLNGPPALIEKFEKRET